MRKKRRAKNLEKFIEVLKISKFGKVATAVNLRIPLHHLILI